MSVIDLALSLAGMPDDEVADFKRELPAFARLADAAKALEPTITLAKPHLEALTPLIAQAMPHINALIPMIAAAWPIVDKAWPDVVGVTPTAQELIAFIKSKLEPNPAATGKPWIND